MSTPWMTLLGLFFAMGAAASSQQREESASAGPAGPSAVAIIDGEPIEREAYEDYLFEQYGRGPLRDLVKERLLERELSRLGLTIDHAELERAWDELRQTWLDKRFGGDEGAMNAELAAQGHDQHSYKRVYLRQKRRELTARAIVLATRAVDEAALRARFEREYGSSGLELSVRQILLTRLRAKGELSAQGRPAAELTVEALDAFLQQRARDLVAALRGGASFDELAVQSHDVEGARSGGRIAGQSWRRYGPELTRAIESAEVGLPTGPVESGSGVHVFLVESRRQRSFEEARQDLLEQARAEPPSFLEMAELDQRLWGSARIEFPDSG